MTHSQLASSPHMGSWDSPILAVTYFNDGEGPPRHESSGGIVTDSNSETKSRITELKNKICK